MSKKQKYPYILFFKYQGSNRPIKTKYFVDAENAKQAVSILMRRHVAVRDWNFLGELWAEIDNFKLEQRILEEKTEEKISLDSEEELKENLKEKETRDFLSKAWWNND